MTLRTRHREAATSTAISNTEPHLYTSFHHHKQTLKSRYIQNHLTHSIYFLHQILLHSETSFTFTKQKFLVRVGSCFCMSWYLFCEHLIYKNGHNFFKLTDLLRGKEAVYKNPHAQTVLVLCLQRRGVNLRVNDAHLAKRVSDSEFWCLKKEAELYRLLYIYACSLCT